MDKFKKFTGARSGKIIEGLSEVKEYLQNYGYISESATNFTNSFDEMLVSATKLYQQYYNIEQTGRLDEKTIGQMMVPRCGKRDIGNDTSFMQHSANHGNLQSIAHYEIFEGRPRWKKRALTFSFLPQNKLPDNYKKTIARGFSKWQAVTPLSFRETGSYSKADIKIGFYSREHGCGHAFDGVLGELAHAYAPPFGWFHFDNDENWVVHQGDQLGHNSKDPTMLTAIDLESVAMHEIGHLLGLGHSVDRNAIMFPTLTYGVRKIELQKDDVDGIQSLYGANPDSSESSPSSHAQNLFRGTPAVSRWWGPTLLAAKPAMALVDIIFL
ncbi:hypothetical protein LWI29_036906 [Acer saccharum]|uniref:Peptidase metallopeptidase domain-containing protein n=1 Tax=Acer saccharum TaxID=4024 RepID=A0AA39RJU5_ACESA|nr:hypothetical protein LWI29_036906 [Acer saccharum]